MMLWEPLAPASLLSPARALRGLPRALRALHQELDPLFEPPFVDAAPMPPGSVYSKENGLLLRVPLPGVDPAKLRLEVEGDVLILSGAWPEEPAAGTPIAGRQERPRGTFTRTLRLPFEVETAQVQARLERGLLEVELPRAERTRPVRIQVQDAQPAQD